MPLPVIADVFQLRLNWTNTSAPRDASNNLYFRDTAGTQQASDLITDFKAAATAAMWTTVSNGSSINRLIATELDGVSAGLINNTASPANLSASGGSDLILQGATVVSIKSTFRGKRGRGRIYLPWVAEIQQTNGVLVPANVATMQTAWDTFLTAMQTRDWNPVVVSVEDQAIHTPVTYTVRPNLLTQRRRARR